MDILNALALFANFVFVPALAYGSQLALGALGITLVYAVLRFANFAHGDTMAFGTMVVILLTWWLQSYGITAGVLPTALIALPVAIAATALFVLATDRLVYAHYRRIRAPAITMTMASIGVTLVMNGVVRFIIGTDDRTFFDGERFLVTFRESRDALGLREGIAIKASQALTVVVAVALVALLFWFLNRTRTGKSMRAFSDNEDLALLSG
ncbi:MAG: branched-chain amino acid ABC transporter permease, partial [Pseudomonadota bacterium]